MIRSLSPTILVGWFSTFFQTPFFFLNYDNIKFFEIETLNLIIYIVSFGFFSPCSFFPCMPYLKY